MRQRQGERERKDDGLSATKPAALRREPVRMSLAKARRTHAATVDASPQPGRAALPGWLRQRYAEHLDAARASIVREAKRGMRGNSESDAGILADRRIKAILASAGLRLPSPATVAAYRRDHAHMLAAGLTPGDKATTFQHFNRLRSAWRFCEVEVIRALRQEAEAARKAGDYSRMRSQTVAAYERAVLLDALFLSDLSAPSRQTWGKKSAALRAAGIGKTTGKSKRAAGRVAPTPDQLLVLLLQQRNRCTRVEIAAAVFACFGIRPAELVAGVALSIEGKTLRLEVCGAKVDETRGQPLRVLSIEAERIGCSGLAVALLRQEVGAGRCLVKLTTADLCAVRRALRTAQRGLSPYAYRHARASDAKASQDRRGVASWLGHRTDRAQSGYGNARSSSGAVKVHAAQSSRPVRQIKTLPSRAASTLAPIETRPTRVPLPTLRRRRPGLR